MKKQKYITIKDVRKEETLNVEQIISLENEIALLQKRQNYLNILEDYLCDNKNQPYVKGNLLVDDFELEHFVLPLELKERIVYLENKLALEKSCKRERKK